MNSVLLFIAVLAAADAARLTLDLDPRIVNGENVKLGEIPFQVSLQLNGRHFCGGSVLNSYYVLTAAHCLEGEQAAAIQVVVGTVNLNSPWSIHQAERLILHKNYWAADKWINDIALIKVKTQIREGPRVSFVPLPKANENIPAGSPAVVSGWGRLQEGGPTTNQLQKARLSITNQNICDQAYNGIFATQICANDHSTNKGACQGDSGGPLTVNGKIVGIVSWSRGCGLAKYPTVYTRVSYYLSWIQQHAV